MQKWEYLRIELGRSKPRFTTDYDNFTATIGGQEYKLSQVDKYMQTLGEQGWELVSTTPVAYWRGLDGMTTDMHLFFKRPKE